MEHFKTTRQSKNPKIGIYFKTVQGERIKISGHECFLFEEKDDIEGSLFNVSHLETGAHIYSHKKKDIAVHIAAIKLDNYPDRITEGIELFKSLEIKLPVNI